MDHKFESHLASQKCRLRIPVNGPNPKYRELAGILRHWASPVYRPHPLVNDLESGGRHSARRYNNLKGVALRIGEFCSGLAYVGLGILTLHRIDGEHSNSNAAPEWRIICTTHNLLKLFRHHWRPVSA